MPNADGLIDDGLYVGAECVGATGALTRQGLPQGWDSCGNEVREFPENGRIVKAVRFEIVTFDDQLGQQVVGASDITT